ncbi:capsular exopolysaccharide family [Peptoclostridium litorale DSM 5388]|uniref:Tyrosine-protein kinase EpsD n=1 Tax=Peptoclostridium litorale DSM 5388 TaxID=1121324 RepID=A0A069RC59_PEPLI|nr:CpsD/CapB family tyrosine-protein kinase [Peptoclostridium litorale]KDR94624.1 tyrosine-protein kinase EpsD [Peptoclostridium litorale DSM 5388]SIO30665.1 capsular exopolysaccharide family [Peptoclostridium litorale DSM 5388]
MKDILFQKRPDSPVSDSYRGIRTSIRFSGADGEIKVVAVTSAKGAEGKTTTVVNVAASMAGLGKRVIVLDFNFRSPALHNYFDISNREGASEVICQGIDPFESISHANGIDVLVSGRKRKEAIEILDSNEMCELVQKLRGLYDYVFIDTPPIVEFPDAAALAAVSDGVVLVCASEKAEAEDVRRAKGLLENVNANIIGVVINNALDRRAYDYGETVADMVRGLFLKLRPK